MACSDAAILDGKAVSSLVLDALQAQIETGQLHPHLHVITVGDDVGSQVFVKQKRLAAERVGILFSQSSLPAETTLQQLRQRIEECNAESDIHGIIVQLPLPDALVAHEREVLNLLDPAKDVDCFHPLNFGLLALGEPRFLPATPSGVLRLLRHYGIETRGKRCVILGKSNIVRKPLGLLLGHEAGAAATVVLCDRHTENLWELTRGADIVVVAAGKHHLLQDPSALRPDGQAVVIDVGIHRVQNAAGKTVVEGDVDADAIRPHCRWLTPVPGGVGPMTVACLLEQVLQAAVLQARQGSLDAGPWPASGTVVKQLLVESALCSAAGTACRAELVKLMARLDPGVDKAALDLALQGLEAETPGHIHLHRFLDWAFGRPRHVLAVAA